MNARSWTRSFFVRTGTERYLFLLDELTLWTSYFLGVWTSRSHVQFSFLPGEISDAKKHCNQSLSCSVKPTNKAFIQHRLTNISQRGCAVTSVHSHCLQPCSVPMIRPQQIYVLHVRIGSRHRQGRKCPPKCPDCPTKHDAPIPFSPSPQVGKARSVPATCSVLTAEGSRSTSSQCLVSATHCELLDQLRENVKAAAELRAFTIKASQTL